MPVKERTREQKEWEAAEWTPRWDEESNEVLYGGADFSRGTTAHGGTISEQRKWKGRSGRVKPLSLDCNPSCTTCCLTEVTECNLQPVHDLVVFISTLESACWLILPIFSPCPAGGQGVGVSGWMGGWQPHGANLPKHVIAHAVVSNHNSYFRFVKCFASKFS